MAQYDLGDVVRETGRFTDTAGVATDPAVVTFSYTNPSGVTTSLVYSTDAALVKTGTGVYYVDIPASIKGVWRWRWLSTGTGAASTEGQFAVVITTMRAGMQNLIDRVRVLTGAGAAEYTIGDRTYWTDSHLQDVLDSNARYVVDLPLAWQPQQISGTVTWLTACTPYRDFEEAPGTAVNSRFVIRDGAGSAIGTALYTPNYRSGEISFGTINQGGTAYYLTAYTYDVHAAAADVWLDRLAHFQDWYDFAADNQDFTRSQAWDHAMAMERLMRGKAGANLVANAGGDLRVSQFVRVDLNR